MSIRIADCREISHDATNVGWRIDEEVLRASEVSDAINFCPRVALEAEMIEPRFNFVLHHHQYKGGIVLFGRLRAEPNVVSPFLSAITDNR